MKLNEGKLVEKTGWYDGSVGPIKVDQYLILNDGKEVIFHRIAEWDEDEGREVPTDGTSFEADLSESDIKLYPTYEECDNAAVQHTNQMKDLGKDQLAKAVEILKKANGWGDVKELLNEVLDRASDNLLHVGFKGTQHGNRIDSLILNTQRQGRFTCEGIIPGGSDVTCCIPLDKISSLQRTDDKITISMVGGEKYAIMREENEDLYEVISRMFFSESYPF